MKAVDADSTNMYHLHSIVIKVGWKVAQFNFDGMLDCFESASLADLRE
jgi:sorbitol-specific phosphotransferase system component IIA